jgi:hypothetical protein
MPRTDRVEGESLRRVSARLWDRFRHPAAEPFPGAEGVGGQECRVKATASVLDEQGRDEF